MTFEYNIVYLLEAASKIDEDEWEDGFGDMQITDKTIV